METLRKALAEHGAGAALRLCAERIAAAPGDAEAHRHLGLIHAAAGTRGSALQAGMRACELAPDDPRAWSDLGRVYALLGELENAAQCFAEAVEIDVRFSRRLAQPGHRAAQAGPARARLRSAEERAADRSQAGGHLS